MTYLLVAVCVVLAALLTISVRFNFVCAKKLMAIEDQVDECLDVLDDSYRGLNQALNHELFSDEPVVKQLVADVKDARDAILFVANKVAAEFDSEPDAEATQ
jgi:hypothetical protein